MRCKNVIMVIIFTQHISNVEVVGEQWWKTINYKKVVVHNRQSGNDRKTYEFFNDVDEILSKKPNIVPDFMISSSTLGDSTKQIRSQKRKQVESEEEDYLSGDSLTEIDESGIISDENIKKNENTDSR